MSTLETADVSVVRGGREILSDATLAAHTGEVLILAGPNGSGKSTLLRTLAGLWRADSGVVLLDGEALADRPRNEIARRIAFVPQDTHVDFAFTVAEILAMGRYPHRGRFAAESAADRNAIQNAAEKCDVANLMDRAIDTLSGGERQRVLIARSLAVEPEFVLLDEPTANLDVEHSLEVLELSRALAKSGHAVILASHDLNLVLQYADRLALLHRGRLVSVGAPDEVLQPGVLETVFNVQAETLTTQAGSSLLFFTPRN